MFAYFKVLRSKMLVDLVVVQVDQGNVAGCIWAVVLFWLEAPKA